jgi:hypothetical protein
LLIPTLIKKLHFAGEFGQFDFGEKENMEKYGQATPPNYNLSLVTSPVALYYGVSDRLVTLQVREFYLHSGHCQLVTVKERLHGSI